MEVLLSDAIIMCPHGGQVNLKNAEASGYGYNNTKAIVYEKLIGAPIAGCSIAGPGLKPCTTIASAVAGMAPTSKGPDGAYCMPFLVCVTDGSPGGPTIVSSPGVQGFGIAPSVAIPAIKAAVADVTASDALTEAQKEEALAQLAKAQSEAEEEAKKEEGKKKKKSEVKIYTKVQTQSVSRGYFLEMAYFIDDPKKELESLKMTIKNEKTGDELVVEDLPIKQKRTWSSKWNGLVGKDGKRISGGLLSLDIEPSSGEVELVDDLEPIIQSIMDPI